MPERSVSRQTPSHSLHALQLLARRFNQKMASRAPNAGANRNLAPNCSVTRITWPLRAAGAGAKAEAAATTAAATVARMYMMSDGARTHGLLLHDFGISKKLSAEGGNP